jgi:hypothetical protein
MKRGQAAMEFVLVAAIVLLIFVPSTFIFMKNIRSSNDELALSKIDRMARLIINTAETVYYEGPPSKRTITGDFPEGIAEMYILSNWSDPSLVNQLIFNYTASVPPQKLVYDSRINLNGTFDYSAFSRGRKTIVLSANRTSAGMGFVYIKIR